MTLRVIPSARRLRRFFSPGSIPPIGQTFLLPAEETHHLRDILRLKVEEACLVVDGSGREAKARIVSFQADGRTQLLVEKLKVAQNKRAVLKIRACVAVPQRGKMDFLVEKAQELGVEELWPLETERTVVKMTHADKQKVPNRWQKIVREAAKQSGSGKFTRIETPLSFAAALEQTPKNEAAAIFHPSAEAIPFSKWVSGLEKNQPLTLFFGPEGGFTDKEVRLARSQKAHLVGLGENILKIDTAFLGVVGALRFLFL